MFAIVARVGRLEYRSHGPPQSVMQLKCHMCVASGVNEKVLVKCDKVRYGPVCSKKTLLQLPRQGTNAERLKPEICSPISETPNRHVKVKQSRYRLRGAQRVPGS